MTVLVKLHQVNPYVRDFVHLGQRLSTLSPQEQNQIQLVLHARRSGSTADDNVRVQASANDTDRFTFQEIAVLTTEDMTDDDFILYARGGGIRRLKMNHRCFDTWYYILLFPFGDDGWHSDLRLAPKRTQQTAALVSANPPAYTRSAGHTSKRLTPRAYYCHRLHWRNGDKHKGGRWLLMGNRLTQEYACTAWSRTESQRLLWHRLNQATLRAETFENLRTEQMLLARDTRIAAQGRAQRTSRNEWERHERESKNA